MNIKTMSIKPLRGQAYIEYVLIFAVATFGFIFSMDLAKDAISENRNELACGIATHGRDANCDGNDIYGGGGDGLPVARFVYSCTDMVCAFDGTSSFDSNGEIVRLEWEFGDETGDGWMPEHTFSSSGEHEVTLTVYDNDGNFDDTTKVIVFETSPECPPNVDVDGLPAGTILTDQFAGVSITTHNPNKFPAMLFDSENPTGGDTDLGSPHKDFGGPGVGSGGRAGLPGENSQPQGMVIIISEDGDSNDPDDRAKGGELIFEFEYDAHVSVLSFLDVDEAPKNPTVRLYDRDGNEFWNDKAPALGDNSYVEMPVDQTGVAKLVVDFPGSGSVDGVFFCDEAPGSGDMDFDIIEIDDDISENQPPSAEFSFSCEDLRCQFDGTFSEDFDGTIESFYWDFGNDMAGNAEVVSHTFQQGGTYNVTLTVTDNDGAEQSVTVPVTLTDETVTTDQGNQDCPVGTELASKFNTSGNSYIYEKGLESNIVNISNANLQGGNWSSNLPISAIIVKGGNGASIHEFSATTSGSFNNYEVPTVGNGNAPDISNIKFCTPSDDAPPQDTGFQCEGDLTVSLALVDADANETITNIGQGDLIVLSNVGVDNISVIANVSGGTPKSIVFEVNGSKVQTENAAPYAIAGDGRGNYNAWNYPMGEVTIRATAYSKKKGQGNVRGCTEITFFLADQTY